MSGAREAAEHLVSRHRLRAAEAAPWIIAVAVYFLLPEYLALGTQVVIMVLFALSLDLVLGYAGIVTLGHAAFFGAGAYTAALLAVNGWAEPVSGLLAGAAVAAVIGLASGWVLLRTQGLTLLMLTMATAIMLHELANEREDLTGGFDGLNFSSGPILGLFAFDVLGFTTQYIYCGVLLFLMFVVVRRIVHSPFGQTLVGIRENVVRMRAVGSPVHRRLVTAYTISAAIAGIAGALFAQSFGNITLDVLSFERSGTVLIVLILGGTGRLYGAFLGGAGYMILEDELSKLDPTFWQFGVGLVLVLAVLFAPRGLLGLVERAGARLAGRRP